MTLAPPRCSDQSARQRHFVLFDQQHDGQRRKLFVDRCDGEDCLWRDGTSWSRVATPCPASFTISPAHHADCNTRDPPLPHLAGNVAIDIVSWCGSSRCRGAGGRPTTAETEGREEGLTCHWPRPPAPG